MKEYSWLEGVPGKTVLLLRGDSAFDSTSFINSKPGELG